MIIILVVFLTSVFAQQEKNIDLLRNHEKPELLHKLAGKIMESVESISTNKQGIELDDADLNAQNSYIQSIMEQETAALEARRRKEDRSSEENNKSKENDDPKEGLEVESFQFREDDVDKLDASADNIGLTVTGLNHPTYDKTVQDNSTDNSMIDNVTGNALPFQTNSITSGVNSEETTVLSTKKSLYEEKGKSILNYKTQMQDSGPLDLTTESQKLNIKNTISTLLSNFDNNSQYETTGVPHLPYALSETVINSTQEILHLKPSLNATQSHIQNSSDVRLTSFLPDESKIISVKYTTANENANWSTKLNTQVSTTTTQNTAEVKTATTGNYNAFTEDRSEKEALKNIIRTTTFIPIFTMSNIKEKTSTKKPKILKVTHPNQSKNENFVSYVANRALKNIKHELELKKKGKFTDNEIETTNKGNIHLNHYQVYEIPWPLKGDKLFLRSQEPMKDQPYFVPVYKYSPNFAYYNSKNRLGPNEVEENSIELDTRLRNGNEEIRDVVEPTEFILQLNNELRKFGYRKRKRKTTSKNPRHKQTSKEEEEKSEKEKSEEEGNAEEEEDKSKEDAYHRPTTTSFIKSDEDRSYLTHGPTTKHPPTTNTYESSINCESTDKESASCGNSKEEWNDSKKKKEHSKGSLHDSKNKHEHSKEGLNESQKKHEHSKEGLNESKKKHEHSKEELNESKKKDEHSKEELNESKKKDEHSKEELNVSKNKHEHSQEELNESKNKDEHSKEELNDSKKKDESSKEGLDDSKKTNENSKEGLNDSKKKEESSKEELNVSKVKDSVSEERVDKKKKGHTITDILSATVEKDLLTNLAKLQELDVPLLRSMVNSKVYIYMNVLKDLILADSKSLKQYDWLTTTVRIQTALSKIFKLIKRMKQSKQLYPADLQILRYMVFLQNFSLEIKQDKKYGNQLRNRVKLLPKNKNKKGKKMFKENDFDLINRVWLYLRTPLSDLVKEDGLRNLYKFLIDVQDELFDLHEAIRYIADVTKFDRQNWYGNLKQLYLSADDKQLRELLLHISMSRLVDLVEHSCKQDLDSDFIQFLKTNKKDAKRIIEEIIFINDIVREIAINKE